MASSTYSRPPLPPLPMTQPFLEKRLSPSSQSPLRRPEPSALILALSLSPTLRPLHHEWCACCVVQHESAHSVGEAVVAAASHDPPSFRRPPCDVIRMG